ncbi:MAG: transglycosylase SLT domain-containing protein [Dehalococcoidia bacterium]|nr:transglycosylase SLT domain-containing protein [Dehalococcoidia bacterium]
MTPAPDAPAAAPRRPLLLAVVLLLGVLSGSWTIRVLAEGTEGTPVAAGPGFVLVHSGRPEPLSRRGAEAMLRQAGWPEKDLPTALAVSGCESGWRPRVVGAAGELGLFQIHPVHRWRFDARFGPAADPFNPAQNAAVALDLFHEEGWAPWSCRP